MKGPIAFGSRSQRYKWAGDTRLVNMMAETMPEGGRDRIAALPAPGLRAFATPSDTPSRGLLFLPDSNILVSVHAEGVSTVAQDGSSVALGVIAGNLPVIMAQNRRAPSEVAIVSEYAVYIVSDGVVRLVEVEAFDGLLPHSCAYLAGRIIYGFSTGKIVWSDVNSAGAVQGLSFATAEDSSDALVRVFVDRSELFLMGSRTVEVWRPTGDADAPFAPVPNATVQRGIVGKYAVAGFDNSIAWVGENGVVYRLESYVPKRISDHGVERLIQSLPVAEREQIEVFTYPLNGHEYLHVHCARWTKVYDAATQQWHDRETLNAGGWRARGVVQAWGRLIAGDRLTGALTEVDADSFTDLDRQIVADMVSPVFHAFPGGMVIHEAHVDLAVGYGSALDRMPLMQFAVSKDGGLTFGDWREVPIGKRGEYSTRAIVRRLGRFSQKGAVIRVRISDPVPRALVSIDIGTPEALAA